MEYGIRETDLSRCPISTKINAILLFRAATTTAEDTKVTLYSISQITYIGFLRLAVFSLVQIILILIVFWHKTTID